MQLDVFEKNYELENRYWWYLSRSHVFHKILTSFFPGSPEKKIVDFGCGSGGVIPMLSRHGQVLGLDIEPQALEFCRSKGFYNVALMKGYYDTGQSSESADLVSLFDVLEHFEDDSRALRETNRILKPGGYTLISVPAFGFLWSELDDAAHHFRRYTRSDMKVKLEQNGFEVVKASYLFFFLFPLVFTYKILSLLKRNRQNPQFRYQEFPRPINRVLVWPAKIEAVLLNFLNFPLGSTLMILARKKKGIDIYAV